MNNIKVLYENENLLVIDKPSGVVVNRAITHSLATVQDFIEENIDSEAQPADDEVSDYQSRSGVVHRLDKDTSGALLVAKNVKTFEALQKQFKDRTIKKEYVAIAIGKITDEKIEINAPIDRNPKEMFKFAVVAGGKESITIIEKLFELTQGENVFTALKVMPLSGRTHQIRVHLAAIGHPVAGDPIYSTKAQYEKLAQYYPRMMLHSRCLEFEDQSDGARKTVCAPVPDEFGPNF